MLHERRIRPRSYASLLFMPDSDTYLKGASSSRKVSPNEWSAALVAPYIPPHGTGIIAPVLPTFTIRALSEASSRGRNVLIIARGPKKLTSNTALALSIDMSDTGYGYAGSGRRIVSRVTTSPKKRLTLSARRYINGDISSYTMHRHGERTHALFTRMSSFPPVNSSTRAYITAMLSAFVTSSSNVSSPAA